MPPARVPFVAGGVECAVVFGVHHRRHVAIRMSRKGDLVKLFS